MKLKDKTAINKKAYNKIAKEWSDKNFTSTKMLNKLDKFITYIKTGKKILDVGCGPGRDTKYLMEHGFDVVGIDFSKDMINEARKRVPNGNFRLMNMMGLDFYDNSFDGVWSLGSFLHIEKKEASAVLKEFWRVLKKCGVLVVIVKHGSGEALEDKYGATRFFAYYTQEELVDLIKMSGFKVLESFVETLDNTWIVVFAEAVK